MPWHGASSARKGCPGTGCHAFGRYLVLRIEPLHPAVICQLEAVVEVRTCQCCHLGSRLDWVRAQLDRDGLGMPHLAVVHARQAVVAYSTALRLIEPTSIANERSHIRIWPAGRTKRATRLLLGHHHVIL